MICTKANFQVNLSKSANKPSRTILKLSVYCNFSQIVHSSLLSFSGSRALYCKLLRRWLQKWKEVRNMVELKAAVKDVTTLFKNSASSIGKTMEVLNRGLVCGSYCLSPSSLVYAWSWFRMASKMDEYMDSLDGYLDEISERLITLGGNLTQPLTEFLHHRNRRRRRPVTLKKVWNVLWFTATSSLFPKADVTDEEGDDVP